MRPAQIYYDRAEAMGDLVFRLCPYLRQGECDTCPAHEHTPGYGIGKRGCRGLAEEAIAIVLEWQDETA